jgi:hypothetical protein
MPTRSYGAGAVVSGVFWSSLVCLGKSPSLSAMDILILLLAGSGTGAAISYIFRDAIQRARLPWALLLPLVTVPAGSVTFAAIVGVMGFGLGRQPVPVSLELLSEIFMALLVLWPLVYLAAFVNQWILQRFLTVSPDRTRP